MPNLGKIGLERTPGLFTETVIYHEDREIPVVTLPQGFEAYPGLRPSIIIRNYYVKIVWFGHEINKSRVSVVPGTI